MKSKSPALSLRERVARQRRVRGLEESLPSIPSPALRALSPGGRGLLMILSIAAVLLLFFLSTAAVSVDSLKASVAWLTDPARVGRMAGSSGAIDASEYIANKLKALGFETRLQEFGSGRRNVVGKFGSARRALLIGSHFDGQGQGMPSASDNAAGVAVLLELARELKDQRLPVSVIVAAFDDEEQGLRGSRYYVENPIYPIEDIMAAVILDTLGRSFVDLPTWSLVALGTEYSPEIEASVKKRSRPELIAIGTDLVGPRSDFAPFALRKVPYVFFTNGTHKDYHGPQDTADRIQYDRLRSDATTILDVATDIARLPAPPTFREEPVYPASEKLLLVRYFDELEKNRSDLAPAYTLAFADLRQRINSASSRETIRMATTSILAAATPRLSGFALSLFVGPFYERAQKKDIAIAVYEEALKWTEGDIARQQLEQKIRSLR